MTGEQTRDRRRIVYTGRVQGVGFRYTVASIAKRYPVCGYVRNLRNRSVELVLDGPPTAVAAMLSDIAAAFEGNIDNCDSSDCPASEEFAGFTVRH
jgi:acylphosphatase